MTMRAWKFLARGARMAWTNEPWPAPGAWLERENDAAGVLVLEPDDLAWWIGPELWEVEADAGSRSTNAMRARRARLVRRVDSWNAPEADALVADVRARARRDLSASEIDLTRRLLADLASTDDANVVTYVAAMAHAVSVPIEAQRARFEAERAAQSRWIARCVEASAAE